jgi:biotin transporter BioY
MMAILGGILGAMIGGNLPSPETFHMGSLVGDEAGGILGFWLAHSLCMSFISDWTLLGIRKLSFHRSGLIITLAETAIVYLLSMRWLSAVAQPSMVLIETIYVVCFFVLPLLTIYGWSWVKKT